MDVVYPIAVEPRNEELRYSLRSLRNLEHARVWTAGHRHRWLTRLVGHVEAAQRTGSKHRNVLGVLRAICEHPEVSDPFILFNDDFFALRPGAAIPSIHRGPALAAVSHYRSAVCRDGMALTVATLARELGRDPGEIMSWEAHTPVVVDKAAMLRALDLAPPEAVAWYARTVLATLTGAVGMAGPDVKVYGRATDWPRAAPWLSTARDAFVYGPVGRWLRQRLSSPSCYEAMARPPRALPPSRPLRSGRV